MMIDDDLYSLCQILNIPEDEINKSFTIWRFSVLHVRGVENLDTEEVYKYFGQVPHSIEWLSNISCNVTFDNWSMAVNTLLNIANGLILHKNEASLEDKANLGLEVYTSDSLEIPVPPNYRYILGNEHPKAKAIIIRFATVNDQKPSQIEPRTSGTDLIKHKPNEDYDQRLPHRSILNSNNPIVRNLIDRNRTRNELRLRMHADDEEFVKPSIKNRSKTSGIWNRVGRPSIRDRLGAGGRRPIQRKRLSEDLSKVDRIRRSPTRNSQIFKTKSEHVWRPGSTSSTAKQGDLRHVLNSRQGMLRVQVNYEDSMADD